MAEIVKRVEFATVLHDGIQLKDVQWTVKLDDRIVGHIHLTEEARFKVKLYKQNGETKWLSSSEYTPLVPFDTFVEARARIQKMALAEYQQ